MSLDAPLSLIICLIGLIIYCIGTEWWKKPPLAEIGKIMFAVGLLVYLLK